MSMITPEIRAKATEIYYGDDVCKPQSLRLLSIVGMPNGLLPLKDIIETGAVEETGFVWLIQKKEIKHKFEKIDKLVSYGTEITAYCELNKIKKLTGVKAKEFFLWVTITDISLSGPKNEKIIFMSNTGISRTFPTSAFVDKSLVGMEALEGVKVNKENSVDKKEDTVEENKQNNAKGNKENATVDEKVVKEVKALGEEKLVA